MGQKAEENYEWEYVWDTHMGTGVSALKSELVLNSPWPFIKLCYLQKQGGSIQTNEGKFSMAWINSWVVRGNIWECYLAYPKNIPGTMLII